jgi:hypothetical protein
MEVFLTIVSTMFVQIGLCLFCFLKKSGKIADKDTSPVSLFF